MARRLRQTPPRLTAVLDKIEAARCQLGTALDLFIKGRDPVSVHCLACGGAEIAESLAVEAGVDSFTKTILSAAGSIDITSFRRLRAQYWNTFKHATARDGRLRDDTEYFRRFNDAKNDDILLIGWSDWAAITGKMPIPAQVFQIWFFSIRPETLATDVDFTPYRRTFGDIANLDRGLQKRALRKVVDKYLCDKALLNDPMTDPRELVSRQ